MKQISIKNILILSFLLITFTVTTVILVQRYFWLIHHERERTEQQYLSIAEAMGKIIEGHFNQRLVLLTQVSEEVLRIDINADKSQKIMESVHHRNPDFRTILVGDAQGRALATSPLYDEEGRASVGRDYSDREWYKTIVESKQPVIGDILIGRVVEETLIPLIVPILSANNELKGFVGGGYGLEPIQEIIKAINLYGDDYIALVDRHGKLVASTKPEHKLMQDMSSAGIFLEAQKKNKGVAEYVSLADNRKKIGAFYNLENGWKIWMGRDVGEMQHAILMSYYHSVLWGIIASLIAIGAAYLLSKRISKPIVILRNHSKQFLSGTLDISQAKKSGKSIISEIKGLNDCFLKMAEELSKRHEELEVKVKERTQKLEDANNELEILNREVQLKRVEAEEAKIQADAANKAKSDFLANMSHELRTPLNAIIGFSDIMAEGMAGPINDDQKEYLGDILSSGRHLLSLINDILDLSKVEAGKMNLELSEFNIEKLIDGCLVMFKEKSMKHNIRLKAEIGEGVDTIIADERKIKQILFNLLSNAMKFTPDGGSVRVTARLVRSSELGVKGSPLKRGV